jgi:hypothetical protein
MDGYYTCEECYRDLSDGDIINEEILVNWNRFRNLVAKSTTPKKIIKILLNRIFRIEYTPEEINQYYIELMDNGSLSLKEGKEGKEDKDKQQEKDDTKTTDTSGKHICYVKKAYREIGK